MSRRSTVVTYNNNHQGQQEDTDGPVDPKLVTMLSVILVAIIFLFCLPSHLRRGTEEQERDAVDSRQRRQGFLLSNNTQGRYIFPQLPLLPPGRNEARGWDRAASMVATAVELETGAGAGSWPTAGGERAHVGYACLADLADGEDVRVLPACMRYFHAACVGEWLRAHDTCLHCHAPVNPAAGAMC